MTELEKLENRVFLNQREIFVLQLENKLFTSSITKDDIIQCLRMLKADNAGLRLFGQILCKPTLNSLSYWSVQNL